jgi:hypothetical protein
MRNCQQEENDGKFDWIEILKKAAREEKMEHKAKCENKTVQNVALQGDRREGTISFKQLD